MAVRILSFDVGTKNLSFCDLSVDNKLGFEVHAWTVASTVPRGINVNKTPIWDLAPAFYNYVRANVKSWLWNADGTQKPMDRVLIENQPMGGRGAARNLKTKVLSHILQCIILECRPDLNVSFVHPGLKLKDMPKPLEGGKTTYRENKLYAINKTAEYLVSDLCKNKDECKELYLDKKMKKDDLADAFLQGLFVAHIVARGDLIEAKNTLEEVTKVEKKAKKAIKASTETVLTPAETPLATTAAAPKAKKTKTVSPAAAAAASVPEPSAPSVPEPSVPSVPVDEPSTVSAKAKKPRAKKTSAEAIAEEAVQVKKPRTK